MNDRTPNASHRSIGARRTWVAVAACALATASAAQPARPPGADKSATTRTLEAGAKLLQRTSPLGPMDIHLVGFHPMKEDPQRQVLAHHYCAQVNEDFAQCALFDGDGRGANLNGIEYIVSERLFETLPAAERAFWHPHNGEILSGQLVAPGIPEVAEKALMKRKLNSYGKTWHLWDTGTTGQGGDKLPLGPPMLAWSFNRDGEVQPGLVAQRDRSLRIDSADKRRRRADLQARARPQSGVDALRRSFPQARPSPGVVASAGAAGAPTPAASR